MGVYSLDRVLERVVAIAKKFKANKVVLFGSRARGDHSEISDYDIAVFREGKLTPSEEAYLYDEIDEIETLKKIDLVWTQPNKSNELMNHINREGLVLYEQARK